MLTCDICGKRPQTGNNKPNSQHRTKRVIKANIQKKDLFLGNLKVTSQICTRCMRSLNK